MAELNRSTAVDTIYNESFKDPLMKIEQRIFGKKAVQKTEVKKTEVKKGVVKRDAEPKKVVPVKSTATPAPKKKKTE